MITTMFFILVPFLKRAPCIIIHLARNAEKGGGVLMSIILPNLNHSFVPDSGSGSGSGSGFRIPDSGSVSGFRIFWFSIRPVIALPPSNRNSQPRQNKSAKSPRISSNKRIISTVLKYFHEL